jgi:hypothetical protein
MSLFDYVIVKCPLPDGFDPSGHEWQTQDTPDQYLSVYTIQTDGTLVTQHGEVVPFHGALTFYTGNVCATGPWGYATRDDAPAWWAEYTALYDHGRLLKLEGAWRNRTTLPGAHLTREAWYARHRVWGECHEHGEHTP